MEVLILGVGDAFTARYFGSSALIRTSAGAFVLIDCPDLFHRALREAVEMVDWPISALDIDDIVLTHLHGDHSNGLESFAFVRRIARAKGDSPTVPRLWAAPEVAARVWEKLAPAMDGSFLDRENSTLSDYFDVHPLNPRKPVEVAGLNIECRLTGHPIPTYGLRVREGDATFGWSSDTPFEQDHVDWLSEAELIVHETNHGSAHTPIENLNALPDAIRNRIRLIHMADDFNPKCTDMQPLTQGELLQIGAKARV